jgi:hypothetical protein
MEMNGLVLLAVVCCMKIVLLEEIRKGYFIEYITFLGVFWLPFSALQ